MREREIVRKALLPYPMQGHALLAIPNAVLRSGTKGRLGITLR
jgi:hypothetical protein